MILSGAAALWAVPLGNPGHKHYGNDSAFCRRREADVASCHDSTAMKVQPMHASNDWRQECSA